MLHTNAMSPNITASWYESHDPNFLFLLLQLFNIPNYPHHVV